MQEYGAYVQGRVLDVGCDEAYLSALYRGRYCGIDKNGEADVVVDLEQGCLPFRDQEFDCVVCTDVLEHIDNLHALFEDLVRVTCRYLILSLPNCWGTAWPSIVRGRGELKQYGLPQAPPEDRHKWFFNYEQAERFVRDQAERLGLIVRVCEPYWGSDRLLKRLLQLVYRFDETRRRNVFARALWAILERRPGGSSSQQA